MAIPMSALRRALAEMADMSGSASLRRSIPAALNNTVGASLGGASLGAAGGLLANMPDDELGETTSEYGNRLMRGIGTGAAIGAGLGAGGVGIAGARGLRAALAEAAAERGIGRAAAREASHVDDAARFAMANEGQGGRSANAEAIEGILGRMTERGPEFDGGIDSLKSLLYYNVPGLRNNPRLQSARTAEELSAILDEAGADPAQWASRIGI